MFRFQTKLDSRIKNTKYFLAKVIWKPCVSIWSDVFQALSSKLQHVRGIEIFYGPCKSNSYDNKPLNFDWLRGKWHKTKCDIWCWLCFRRYLFENLILVVWHSFCHRRLNGLFICRIRGTMSNPGKSAMKENKCHELFRMKLWCLSIVHQMAEAPVDDIQVSG